MVAAGLAGAVVLWLIGPWMLAVVAVAAGIGLAAYLLKRSASGSASPFSSLLDNRGWRELKGVPDRFQDIPPGCLMAVLVASAIWIVVWLILLIVGLTVLLGG